MLFVVLLPIILVLLIIKAISKKSRQKLYFKNKISGRKLVMTTTVDTLDKMEDFELGDFFKYLFFYQGFSTKKLDTIKNCLVLEKNNRLFLMMHSKSKQSKHEKLVSKLAEAMAQNNIQTGIYVTSANIGEQFKIQQKTNGIDIIDRPALALLIQNVSKELQNGSFVFDQDSDKPVDELLEKMYPNSI
ncbi:MAG: hypothetical protein IJW24_00660 [Clostridia bacterium]|nr:hypothetical protein [Clostridia bacterium]